MSREKHQPGVLVCVTDQFSCERLILAGRQLADEENLPLHVLSVVPPQASTEKKSEALEYLYRAALEQNASMTLYFHSDSALMTAAYIKKYHMRRVVTGMPGQVNGFVQMLHTLCPDVPLTMVPPDGQMITLSETGDRALSAGAARRHP